MLAIILEGNGGARRTLGRQLVALMISESVEPSLPIASPGFLASITTSPSVGSKLISVISASAGMMPLINRSDSVSVCRIDGSDRTTTRLWRRFTMSVTT